MPRAAAPKVAIITMFQPGRGQDGELTRFRRGLRLRPWPVAGMPPGASWRNDAGVAALVAGVGPVNTAVNVLTWALRAGVDWRRTYWLVCGIAGGNPAHCSLGSSLWANWVVDGDLAHDFHAGDHPAEWDTGILPLGAAKPFVHVKSASTLFGRPAQVFHLHEKLAAWAWAISRRTKLRDTPALAKARAPWASFAAGSAPPTIDRGAVLSAARFWHGARHHAWAERWVPFWTRGRGRFFASSMEDSGTLGALRRLRRLGLADWRRVLLLRSVSNYTLPETSRATMAATHPILQPNDPGLAAALENNWRTAQPVIRRLLAGGPSTSKIRS